MSEDVHVNESASVCVSDNVSLILSVSVSVSTDVMCEQSVQA